ncbi:SPW repeat-containing protein [Roseiarcus fermentans]|uniref:SPW repeat-containing protein n=1 Tax=Roseiarcus fermentans TaxID=1473586 RepID=A0A366FDA5_9HYPH|nr:SPW repeat protein [Roseiarcus fermentans]RBP11930.1 SPW repeat-containing protein [Roseiarcus fermentans]
MPIETSRRGGRSVQDWIMLICGVLLFVAPWAMGFSSDAMAARAAWVGGIVIAAMAMAALVQFAEWEDWVALIAGVLMIVAPWALGFAALQEAVWPFVALGLITALASLSEIWMLHSPEHAAR